MDNDVPEWFQEIAKRVDMLVRPHAIRQEFLNAIREIYSAAPEQTVATWRPQVFQYGWLDRNGKEVEVLRDAMSIKEKMLVLAAVRDHCIATDRLKPFAFAHDIVFDPPDSETPDVLPETPREYNDEERQAALREMRQCFRYIGFCDYVEEIINSGESTLLRYLVDVEEALHGTETPDEDGTPANHIPQTMTNIHQTVAELGDCTPDKVNANTDPPADHYLGITLNIQARTISRDGYDFPPIELSPRQFEFLRLVVAFKGQEVPPEKFAPPDYNGDVSGLRNIQLKLRDEKLYSLDLVVSERRIFHSPKQK